MLNWCIGVVVGSVGGLIGLAVFGEVGMYVGMTPGLFITITVPFGKKS